MKTTGTNVEISTTTAETYPLPNLTNLKNSGVDFTQAWANPVCSPTRASIFTGLYPWRTGVGHADDHLPETLPDGGAGLQTLASVLADGNNYAAALFGKWHLGGDKDNKNLTPIGDKRKWKDHKGDFAGGISSYTNWERYEGSLGSNYSDPAAVTDYATEDVVRKTKKWISQQSAGERWWVTMAFNAPHSPFEVPPNSATYDTNTNVSNKKGKYNAMVQSLDYYTGKLWDNSFEEGINNKLSNTVIIFVGDNGTPSDVVTEEAKNTVYIGGVHVPMIIADGKKVLNAGSSPTYLNSTVIGTSVGFQTHIVDLYSTILGIMGTTTVSPYGADSKSMVAYLDGSNPTTPSRTYNFSQMFNTKNGAVEEHATISDGTYKLNYQDGVWELFKISTDYSESNDLISKSNVNHTNARTLLKAELQGTPYKMNTTEKFPNN